MPERKKQPSTHASRLGSARYFQSPLLYRVLARITLIVVACFIAYFPSINGGFILDDDIYVTHNRIINASDGLYRFWCTTETIDFWPVSNTTLWMDWRLWRTNSTGYHVTNLILHIVESLLIWIILRKLSIPGAFLAAVIFAVHPVNVESVAWIAQRKNTTSMLFFLLSILWYLKAVRWVWDGKQRAGHFSDPVGIGQWTTGDWKWYWLSLTAFALGMLSKGSVLILPAVLLGVVWWLRPLTKRDLLRTAPFFLVAVSLAVVNMWFQTHGSGTVIRNAGFTERLMGGGTVVWFYLYKAFLPLNLAFIYPPWPIESGNPLWWIPLLAAFMVTAVLWLNRATWSRPFLFAWGLFCVALVPVMGFVDVGFMKYSLVSDHYQHISIISPIVLVSAGWSNWHCLARKAAHWATTMAITVLGIFTCLSCQQNQIYRDEITLYKATLLKNPNCYIAHYNLGVAYYDMGKVQNAIEYYRQTLAIKPGYVSALINLGGALSDIGQDREAIKYFEQVLRIDNKIPETHYDLGNSLVKTGSVKEAIQHYELALLYKPDYPQAHNNLAALLIKTGRPKEAIEHLKQTLEKMPDDVTVWRNMATAYAMKRQSPEAIAAAGKALELARSQGQTALARQIEDWLNSYRAGLSGAAK
jgi:protein O-mannosyl-transferase